MNIKSSIALATYNGERYLESQIHSFSEQTLVPDELIISDDNSNDRTFSVLKSFAQNAPFKVKILRNEHNVGYSRNFERAIKECSGDLIFISDQDDFWFPEKIERMVSQFRNNPDLQLLACDVEFTDRDLNPTGKTKFGNFNRLGIPLDNFVAGCASAFRREILDLYLPIPEVWKYDDWLHAIGKLLGTRDVEPFPLQYYRRHGSNTSEDCVNRISGVRRCHLKTTIRNALFPSPVALDLQKKTELYKRITQKVSADLPRVRELARDIEILEQRAALIERPLATRWVHALRLLGSRGNKDYPVYSAVKDSFLN